MTTLYMTLGLPGSGKSTWATEQLKVNGNTTIINKDDLRAMLHDGKHTHGREKAVLLARDALIHALLPTKDVIVADTNLASFHKETLQVIAKFHGAKFVVKDFTHIPLAECIKRDAGRANPVGSKVIRGFWDKYLKPPPPVRDPSLPDCIIVDVDGTLANHDGMRSPYDDHLAATDKPHQHIVDLVRVYVSCQAAQLIIMSGRDEGRSRLVTAEWIEYHLELEHDDYQLFMRPAGDVRKDSIIKRELYEAHVAGKYNVDFVVDDRDQVVRMWRDELGLACIQVADGDF